MKNFFKALFWFLVLALIAVLFHYFYGKKACGVCASDTIETKLIQGDANVTKKPIHKLSEFVIKAKDGSSIFTFPSSFIVNSSNSDVEVSENMLSFKDSIYNYLNNNQGKELIISAKYLESEGELRGLDRANFLKNLLVKANINPNRIIPKAVMSDYSYDTSNKYNEGIAMLFQNIPEDHIKAVEASIENKVLYSEFGATEFKADRSLQAYAFELKNYLNKYPNKQVVITGHTDNVGKSAPNYKLGMKRAKLVKDYLIGQGISKSRLSATSKGETAPVATNETDEGRALNRRMEINIK